MNVTVHISTEVHEARARARAEADACDLAVAAHRCAQDALAAAALDTEPTQVAKTTKKKAR